MNVASVFDRKEAGLPALGSVARIRKPAALGGGCGGRRMKLRGGHFDRSITTNQRRSKDFSATSIRVPHSFYSRLLQKAQPTIRSSTSTSLSRMRSLSCGRGSRYSSSHSPLSILQEPGRSDRPLAASPHVKK